MPEGTFEDQPATKRDLAEVSEELVKEIHRVEGGLEKKIDRKIGALSVDMKKGFHNLEEILKGPEGLSERLERVKKRVGLSV